MSKSVARLLSFAMLFAGLLFAGVVDTARAQPTAGVDTRLCIGIPTTATIATCLSSTPVATVAPYAAIFYVIDVSNALTGAPGPVNVTDTFQPGFHFGVATCTATGISPCNPFIAGVTTAITTAGIATATSPVNVNFGALPLQTNQSVQIVITGFFSVPNNGTASNSVTITGGTVSPITSGASAQVVPDLSQTNDLSIVKTVLAPPPPPIDVSNGPQTVHYRAVITNTGPAVFLGQLFTLNDELRIPLTSAPLQATFVSATCTASAGSDCLATTPILNTSPQIAGTFTFVPFLKWQYPTGSPGLLLSGGTMTFEWIVKIDRVLDCVKQQSGGDFLHNHAFFNLTATNGTTITEQNPNNNTSGSPLDTNSDVPVITGAFIVDPFCGVTIPGAPPPKLAMTKVRLPPLGTVSWPGAANYRIQLKNNGTTPITNIHLLDFMREDPGTPPHHVQLMTWNCIPAPLCVAVTPAIPPGPVQSQQFYFAAKQMWQGTIPVLGPSQTVTVNLTVSFTSPSCDSLDATQPNTNTNLARASYQANVLILGVPTLVTYHLAAAVTTPMATVPKCQFNVAKTFVGPHPVAFPKTVTYKVVFQSLEAVPRQVVVYDALRAMPANLTAGMPFTSTYSCAPVGVSGPIPSGSTSGTVVNTTLPSQGVRIFQSNGFLIFAPGATLTCTVNVTVSRPPPSDPFCLGAAPGGQLENLAYMTVSLIPNNNVFPPSGTYNGTWPLPPMQPAAGMSNWRSLTDFVPRCFNLVVNKSVAPATTWTPGGPPAVFTLSVKNVGPNPITSGPNVPVLTDIFTPPHNASSAPSTCSSGGCVFLWAPNPPLSGPTRTLTINALPANSTITTVFTVPPPFTVPAQSNAATVAMGGPNGAQLWYPKNPATLSASATIPVLPTNSLTVEKTVAAPPPPSGGLPNLTGVTFPVNVVCTPYGPSTTVTLTPTNLSQVIPNIPVGSTCHVVEQTLTSTGTCGRPLVSVALPPTYVPGQNVQILALPATPKVVVNNFLDCVQMNSLTVTKRITNQTPGIAVPPLTSFGVNVACTPFGPNTSVTLTPTNPSQVIPNIRVGSACNITEQPPPQVPGTCSPGANVPPVWLPPTFVPGQNVTIAAPPATPSVIVNNTLSCGQPTGTVVISNLPMQGGNQNTPCPQLGVVLQRANASTVPYLSIMLSNLDQQCATKGPGFKLQSITFLTCAPDPRGPGFGPNATADLTCGP